MDWRDEWESRKRHSAPDVEVEVGMTIFADDIRSCTRYWPEQEPEQKQGVKASAVPPCISSHGMDR
jgi:hypothetical protein